MIIFALLLPTLLGFSALALFLRDEQTGLLERICLGWPLGAGLLTMQMFILGLLRVPFTLASTVIPLILEIVLLCCWLVLKKIAPSPKPRFELWDALASQKTTGLKKAALLLLVGWATIKIASIFVETGLRPIFAWDAWANWTVGAKLFYFTKGLMLDAAPQDFFTRGAVLRITNYPLHNPLMQVWMGLWTGGFDEVAVKFWTPAYLLSMAVYLYLVAGRELGRLAALGLLVIVLSSPLMSYHAVEVYSDLPLSVYLLLASGSFLMAMRGKQAYWPLVALFSAEALFTKDEAPFFVAPLLLSAAVFLWQATRSDARRGKLFISLFVPLAYALPWFLFKFSHKLGMGMDTIKLEIVFRPEILWPAFLQFVSLDNFNVLLVFFPVLLVAGGRPSRETLHLLFPVACFALFFMSLYLLTSFYFEHFNRGTVFYRNILTYYPVLALLTVLVVKKHLPLFEKSAITHRKK